MARIRVSEDMVTVSDFKARASDWLRRIAGSGHPLVITQNGRPAGVLLSPREFDRLREQQRFLESVAAGICDADAGGVMDTDELRRRLASRRTKRST